MIRRRRQLTSRVRLLRRGRIGREDRGSESVELAILLPIGILILAMLVVGARIALAGERITGVAGIAARDASLARAPGDARRIATTSATDALRSDNLHCTNIRVDVDTSGFAFAPGTAATITVDVWCTVTLSDLGVRGLPGSRTLHDTAVSPLDPARDVSLGFGIGEDRSSDRDGSAYLWLPSAVADIHETGSQS